MRVLASETYEDMSRRAADLFARQLAEKPNSLFVLPTGNTPQGLFNEVISRAKAGLLDTSKARFAVLDEYAGLRSGDRRSLTAWLRRALLDHLGVGEDQLIAFDPKGDSKFECETMERAIATAGGIDLAVLGLGPNGHLGMNEPGTPFDTPTSFVQLTPETVRSNAVYWGSEADVPRTGFTLGLGTLLGARSFLLLVNGAHKAGILAQVVAGPADTALPATIVHLHPSATIIADRSAWPNPNSR